MPRTLLALLLPITLAWAAPAEAGLDNIAPSISRPAPDAKMMLEADQLIYDYDRRTVSAVGHVHIYYGEYTLQALRVTYFQATGRLVANGGVRITEPGGVIITAEDVDVTDDFRDGFVAELRVETIDKTYFAARNAERVNGERTVFRRGVYTACEPCRDRPDKPPLWQIKAGKIIYDQKEHVITFEDARFEFLGVPIAWVPVFWTADPQVRRKSGFLAPDIIYSSALGYGARVSYFWAIKPNYDLTFSPAYLSRQGLLASVEWRHRLPTGSYSIAVAGINQADPAAFVSGSGTKDATGTFAQGSFRGGLRTTGKFQINPSWNYGWDFTLLTDRTFARNYHVINDSSGIAVSEAHLTGLRDRNYLDLRAYYFLVTIDRDPTYVDPNPLNYPTPNAPYSQGRQAIVHPLLDHRYTWAMPVFGGEATMRTNVTSLSRAESDTFDLNGDLSDDHTRGPAGTFTRASSQLDWRRQIVGPGGLLLTPFAFLRGDAFALAPNGTVDTSLGLTTQDAVFRGMPAAGIEARWPWMATSGRTTHVFEPVVQLIARPDEAYAGMLPNEDSQSLVFDDTNLFKWNKFSGFDRIEGGTRVNYGLQYFGRFLGGISVQGLVGQSIHVAGLNSFATYDLAGATSSLAALTNGTLTGLEAARSDYVGRLSVDGGNGYRITVRGRMDPTTFVINRGEVEAAGPIGFLTASTSLIYLRNLKDVASGTEGAFVLRGAASAHLFENWRIYGSALWDLQRSAFVGGTVGLAYDDECLTVSVAYNEVRENYSDITPAREVWLKIQLRTLAQTTVATNLSTKQ